MRTSSPFRRLLWTIAVACVLAGGLARAVSGLQSPASSSQKPTSSSAPSQAAQTGGVERDQKAQAEFRAGVNLVRVDVHPTADGKPVTDLTQQDFEVLEDGVRQDIRSFELVSLGATTGGPTTTRQEPRNVRESNEMAANDPRARLFVLFLDTYHIHPASVRTVRGALTRLIDRMLGPDDLIAVMTPEMSASAMTFTRRPSTIATLLDKFFVVGRRRGGEIDLDPKEERYQRCYVGQTDLVQEMIARRREKLTLDALEDLVNHLEGLRDERKAVLAVTEGWALYRPDNTLGRALGGRVPGGPPAVGVGPDGRLRTGDTGRDVGDFDVRECDQDRMRMAADDDDRQFRLLLDVANRANTTFYPIEPRGLPVFDNDIDERATQAPAPAAGYIGGGPDALHARHSAMTMLAVNTDGFAIMNSNDIDANLRKVADDMSSYYLLGYSSTNTKLDGKFRAITVRVKRPGVSVRARRGYRGATKEELEARAAASVSSAVAATPVSKELATLGKVREVAFVRARAGYQWSAGADGSAQPVLWLAAELDPAAGSREPSWRDGADISFVVSNIDKEQVAQGKQTVTRESRSFLWRLTPDQGMTTGDFSIRLTSKPAGAPLGSSETLHVFVPKPPAAADIAVSQPFLLRRGPFTGPNWIPAGDPRYRRQERVKVEVSVAGSLTDAGVRLLDRAGSAMTTIPVVVNRRTENGNDVVSGEVVLAPLTTGDYLLETTVTRGAKTQKSVVAFRIIP